MSDSDPFPLPLSSPSLFPSFSPFSLPFSPSLSLCQGNLSCPPCFSSSSSSLPSSLSPLPLPHPLSPTHCDEDCDVICCTSPSCCEEDETINGNHLGNNNNNHNINNPHNHCNPSPSSPSSIDDPCCHIVECHPVDQCEENECMGQKAGNVMNGINHHSTHNECVSHHCTSSISPSLSFLDKDEQCYHDDHHHSQMDMTMDMNNCPWESLCSDPSSCTSISPTLPSSSSPHCPLSFSLSPSFSPSVPQCDYHNDCPPSCEDQCDNVDSSLCSLTQFDNNNQNMMKMEMECPYEFSSSSFVCEGGAASSSLSPLISLPSSHPYPYISSPPFFSSSSSSSSSSPHVHPIVAIASVVSESIPYPNATVTSTSLSKPLASSCHQCRVRKPHSSLLKCCQSECKYQYCYVCIKKHYSDLYNLNSLSSPSFSFVCPSCHSCCKCTKCQRRKQLNIQINTQMERDKEKEKERDKQRENIQVPVVQEVSSSLPSQHFDVESSLSPSYSHSRSLSPLMIPLTPSTNIDDFSHAPSTPSDNHSLSYSLDMNFNHLDLESPSLSSSSSSHSPMEDGNHSNVSCHPHHSHHSHGNSHSDGHHHIHDHHDSHTHHHHHLHSHGHDHNHCDLHRKSRSNGISDPSSASSSSTSSISSSPPPLPPSKRPQHQHHHHVLHHHHHHHPSLPSAAPVKCYHRHNSTHQHIHRLSLSHQHHHSQNHKHKHGVYKCFTNPSISSYRSHHDNDNDNHHDHDSQMEAESLPPLVPLTPSAASSTPFAFPLIVPSPSHSHSSSPISPSRSIPSVSSTSSSSSSLSPFPSPSSSSPPKVKYLGSCHCCKVSHLLSELYFCHDGTLHCAPSQCHSDAKMKSKRICQKKYCENCMKKCGVKEEIIRKLKEAKGQNTHSHENMSGHHWICPSCEGVCVCAYCKKQREKQQLHRNQNPSQMGIHVMG